MMKVASGMRVNLGFNPDLSVIYLPKPFGLGAGVEVYVSGSEVV
jgi:hypothetical protein